MLWLNSHMRESRKIIPIAISLLVVSLLLQACGFKLRGNVAISPDLAPVYVKDQGGTSQIAVLLRDAFSRQGITVVNDSSQANTVLSLSQERFDRKVLTVSSTGQVQEYSLIYAVEFFVVGKDNTELLRNTVVNIERVLRFDESALSAKSAEANVLQKNMLSDASRQILRQMEYMTQVR